jgi:hypothetical protein
MVPMHGLALARQRRNLPVLTARSGSATRTAISSDYSRPESAQSGDLVTLYNFHVDHDYLLFISRNKGDVKAPPGSYVVYLCSGTFELPQGEQLAEDVRKALGCRKR